MRGKDEAFVNRYGKHQGSPPLARERLNRVEMWYIGIGITPACAGKTISLTRQRIEIWDHPRLRGKDGKQTKEVIQVAGSPPLARERRCRIVASGVTTGITPACAGKTPAFTVG